MHHRFWTALLIFFLGSFSVPYLYGQLVQTGQVRELNSGKQPVAGVQIIYEDAVPATSDQAGRFRLVFQDKGPGDFVFLTEVRKTGFELVNQKEVEQFRLSSTERLGTDIILARAGVVDAAKIEYYAISEKALQAGFEQEKRALREALKTAELSQRAYEEQYTVLLEQFEQQRRALDDFAEKFARLNFDDVSGLYREALELFKSGRVLEAQQKWEEADPVARVEQGLAERERIDRAQAGLAQEEQENEDRLREDLDQARNLAETYLLQFQFDKAEALYDRLLRADSSDLQILGESFDFYRQIHAYEKAVRIARRLVDHPDVSAVRRANLLGEISELYQRGGKLEQGMAWMQQKKDAFLSLLEKDPGSPIYKSNLGMAYSSLGDLQVLQGAVDSGLQYFRQELSLFRQVLRSGVSGRKFQRGLALAFERMGQTFLSLGRPDSALYYFDRSNRLFGELYLTDTGDTEVRNNFAISFMKLGDLYRVQGRLEPALSYYQEQYRLAKATQTDQPGNSDYAYSYGVACERVGDAFAGLGQPDSAFYYLRQQYRLFADLAEKYPAAVAYRKGLAAANSKLASLFMSLDSLEEAERYLAADLRISRELWETNGRDTEVQEGYAFACYQWAELLERTGQLDSALHYRRRQYELRADLVRRFPDNPAMQKKLGAALLGMAYTFRERGEVDSVFHYFRLRKELARKGVAENPRDPVLLADLAFACEQLGNTWEASGQLDSARRQFEEEVRLGQRIRQLDTTNLSYAHGLAYARLRLGEVLAAQAAQEEALIQLRKAESIWLSLIDADPEASLFPEYLQRARGSLFQLRSEYWDVAVKEAYARMDSLEDPVDLIGPQTEIVNVWWEAHQLLPENPEMKTRLAQELGRLSAFLLYDGRFEEAEASAAKGLELDEDQLWIGVPMFEAVIFQGRAGEVLDYIGQIKDQPYDEDRTYGQVFMEDLELLEEAGITHPDVAKVRALLKDE